MKAHEEDEAVLLKVWPDVLDTLKREGMLPIEYPVKRGMKVPWITQLHYERIDTTLFGMPAAIVVHDIGYHEVIASVTINPPEKGGYRLAHRTNKTDLLWTYIWTQHRNDEQVICFPYSSVDGSIQTRQKILHS